MREDICTNAFKQFIPKPFNSRFLSEANDSGGRRTGLQEGWVAWQLGERSEPHLPAMSSDWQPFTWITKAMTKGKPVCGTPQLFREMFVSDAPISIIR